MHGYGVNAELQIQIQHSHLNSLLLLPLNSNLSTIPCPHGPILLRQLNEVTCLQQARSCYSLIEVAADLGYGSETLSLDLGGSDFVGP